MKASSGRILRLLILALSASHVTCKGAKVRPGSRTGNSKDRTLAGSKMPSSDLDSTEKQRGGGEGGGGGGEGGKGDEDDLREITSFLFRSASFEEQLLVFLFRDYDPIARAVIDTDQTVNVHIDFVLLRIHGLDERAQVLTTTGLVIAEWTDERLKWKPSQFGNLTNIIIKADKIWLPELAVMNGADELIPDFERIRVLLHSNGRLHWEPGGIFRTTCDIDIAYFPFDTQHCPLLIGAYSYSSSKMNITNATSAISTHDFRMNGEWQVCGTSAKWNITMLSLPSGDGYAHVVFTLHLKRRYKFYIMNIVLPCVMLSVLIMIGFCLPPDAGEKISLGISVLLAFTVFLLMIADNIPRTSLAIPLIVTYLMSTMTLGTVSICMTVLVLNIHHRGPRHRPIPSFLRRFIFVYVARIVCVQTTTFTSFQQMTFSGRQIQPTTTTKDDVWKRRSPIELTPDGANDCREQTPPVAAAVAHSNGPTTADERGGRRPKQKNNSNRISSFLQEAIRLRRRPWLRYKVTGGGDGALTSHGGRGGGGRGGKALRCIGGGGGRGGVGGDGDCSSVEEWREMAQVVDRAFFWLLFWLMTISTVVILFYPKYIGNEFYEDGCS